MTAEPWRAPFGRPVPRFNPGALTGWLQAIGNPDLVVRGQGASFRPPGWSDAGLVRLFGLDAAHHCFHSQPHPWTKFHEPQITGGLAYFLNDGSPARRLARAIAFVQAAATCAGRPTAPYASMTRARVTAEENRTDLLVTLSGAGRSTGASIEAKFGHHLTPGQLPKAQKQVDALGWDLDAAVLLVVGPDAPRLHHRIRRWQSTSWWALLASLETSLDPVHDCDDFRRFRRTIWYRAYGGF